jgi:alpha-glucosidase
MFSKALHFLLPILCISFLSTTQESIAQNLGAVTHIQLLDNALFLSVGTDVVVFKPCTENILMVNYRPNGIKDPDTLVVGRTNWIPLGATIDTLGDPLTITTGSYRIEIGRDPLRFHMYRKLAKDNTQLLCEEPSTGGILPNSAVLTTSGGTFYGVHNRSRGSITSQTGGTINAGSQGQAGGPFAWTTRGWGFLADVDGGSISIGGNSFSFTRPSAPSKRDLEFYLIVGRPKEIIKGLHEITGFPPLFPKYTLGFMNTEWGIDQTELYSDIRTYRQKLIPIDAYILDFDWMDWGSDNYGEFRWGPKFPDGQSGAIVDSLKLYGMNLMGIRKPRVHVNTIQGQYCQNNGFFVDYVTDYFSGKLVGRLNFQDPAVRKWYWESFAVQSNSYSKGLTGYWNDEADEYGGNLMFMQMQRAQYEGQRAFNNKRVWSINRNFYTGAQRYAYALWSGDIQSGFSAMADQRLFMLSSITLGASWWGMDIGGFQSTPSPANYYRWIQFGAFVPVFRVHGSYNQEREPWYYGAEAESIATKYIRLRYRLMPYIYSAAWENHLTGVSIVRPLVFEYPRDPAVENISSEWMFGNSLLVSPVVQADVVQQTVYLPEGDWYDFNSGKHYVGTATYNVPVTTVDIPIFVKGGSIIPMSTAAQYVSSPEMQKTVILASYPGGTGKCTVYDDDGVTYDYENGAFCTSSITNDRNDQRAIIGIGPRTGSFMTQQRDWLAEMNWVISLPDSIVLDGIRLKTRSLDSINAFSITGWAFDVAAQKCLVKFPDNNAAHTLVVYFGITSSTESTHGSNLPKEYELEQNYPNPFNPSTTIRYSLPSFSTVRLEIFNALGQSVERLFDTDQEAGIKTVQWNALVPSGLYFCRLEAASIEDPSNRISDVKKMVVLR